MKFHIIESFKSNWIIILFALISTLIVANISTDKFIFTLDLIPRINNHNVINSIYGLVIPQFGGDLPFNLIQNAVFYNILQKLLLLFILFLSGFSAYRAVPVDSIPAKLFAGLLYMLNPYVYVRILAGHWLILLGYAVLPLAVKSFINLLDESNSKNLIKVVLLTTLIGFSSHVLIMALIAYFIILSFKIYNEKYIENIKNMIKNTSLVALIFLLLNSYWLLPLVTVKDSLINSIGSEDFIVFTPHIESFSALFTLASMHGFWRTGYVYTKDFLPLWQVLFIFILFLAVQGFISYYKDENKGVYVKSFAAIAIVGLILAAGIQSPFSESFRWLFDHTLLKGMRDSQRFVTLLVITYAYLGALGVESLSEGVIARENRKRSIFLFLIALALITPIIYSFTFFNGFVGQIKPTDYPADWYEINEFLNNDSQEFKTLFLPWHMYMDFHWVPNKDRRLVNPAPYFFDKEMISGENIEISRIYRQINSPDQLYIDFLLKEHGNITNFGMLIAPLNIKYILLTKEVDYKNYFFLFNQSDLELVKETENFYVFENKHKVAKIYEVDSITYISDWKELLERSRKEDIAARIYLIGNSSINTQENSDKKFLDYQKENPVRYKLKERSSKKYLVFTEPYSESWELDSKKPMAAYGVVNAYEMGEASGKEIIYGRFYRVYFPSYVISVLTLIVLIIVYLDLNRKAPWIIKQRD